MDTDDRTETLRAFQTLLNQSWDATEQRVEMTALRRLCARGIPNRPQHLRPLAYSLLLETVPPEKRSWKDASRSDRERYYKLVKSFMEDLLDSPAPNDVPLEKDSLLMTISKDVERMSTSIALLKRRSTPSRRSPFYPPPRDDTSPVDPGQSTSVDPNASESSSSESERDEHAFRSEDYVPKRKYKGKGKAVEHMASRRAPFFRLEQLAIAEHQRKSDARRQASGSSPMPQSFGALLSQPDSTTDSPEEPFLSPRITLSPEETDSPMPSLMSVLPANPRLAEKRPPPLQTPQLSLSVSDASPTSSSSPITLLSPKPIPAPGSAQLAMISGSLLLPDTHAECITRLLYSFCHSHPQWKYRSHFVDILVPLYLVFAGPSGTGKWAEEETFWAFAAMMGELGEIIAADEDELEGALQRLGRRVKWADYDLYDTLIQRNLDPAAPIYAYRWMTSLFTNSLPPPAIFPIWDFLLAEEPRTADVQPKLDLLVDLCVALMILCKPRLNGASVVVQKQGGLWGDDDDDGVNEADDDAFVNGLNLLRAPPLNRIGGVDSLLQIAFKLRQARMVAALSGDDPDAEVLSAPSAGLPKSNSWTASIPSISQYASSIQSSETTASLSKAAAGWTSAARATLSGAGMATAAGVSAASTSASTGLTAAANRFLGSWRRQQSSDADAVSEDDNYGSIPSTPPKVEPPPRFVEPRDTVRYSQLPASLVARRDRSDTAASGTSIASLQEKLSSFASSMTGSGGEKSTPMHGKTASFSSPSGPRPLLLSGSARRASNSSQPGSSGGYLDRSKRDSTPSGSPPNESQALSPPHTAGSSLSRGFGSQGLPKSPRSSLLMELKDGSDKPLDGGPIHAAQAAIFLGTMMRRRIPPRTFLSGLIRLTAMRPTSSMLLKPLAAFSTSRSTMRSQTPNYEGHVPLSSAQNALLAVGSGIMGVLDTTRGDLIATLSESTASTFLPSLHEAMTSHPEGRQIVRDRPLVSSQTVDLLKLKALRRGTLGREYVEWLERGNLSPDSRAKVQYIDSPTLAYTMLRYRQTHDLYHTLFSLPPTLVHELTLKVVEFSNMSLPVAALSSTFGPLRLSSTRRALWRADWVPWALRTGREGRSLVGVYWEKRWEQGIGELRRELGMKRNDVLGVEGRWRGYRELREMERGCRKRGEWVDEPEEW